MREIDTIVIHCSATPADWDIGADWIDRLHRSKGWRGIGYHFVIRRAGMIETGRRLAEQGAHVKGHNETSIGICLVGGVDPAPVGSGRDFDPADNFTAEQYRALGELVDLLLAKWPAARVLGHRDLLGPGDPPKACPSFDVAEWIVRDAQGRLGY